MKNYHDLLRDILMNGQREPNRTGIDTITLPGAMLKFDLREGFPTITTKELKFGAVVGELIGFLRGYTSAADFRALDCNVWNKNANENAEWLANPNRKGEDNLGRIYGAQWRDWQGTPTLDKSRTKFTTRQIDQIAKALDMVRNDPTNRRIIVSAWNPGELPFMALPPCHVLFQLLPRSDGTLHMTMYQRSCDMFLGVPFNIASYALLLELFAAWSGRKAATLTMFLADAHIYVNHVEQVKEQLGREEYPLPKLVMMIPTGARHMDVDELIGFLEPHQFELEGYQSHPAIRAPMAV